MQDLNFLDIDISQVVDCVKKVYPLEIRYVEETPYYKKYCLVVDTTLMGYEHFYLGDVIRYVGKNNILDNPIPMVTQSYQVSQDSAESETWQVENFDVNLAGLWIKEVVDSVEYIIKCDTRILESMRWEFSVSVNKNNIDKANINLINKVFECAKEFFIQKYDISVKIFVKDMLKRYNLTPERMINFLEKLLKHKDILNEFFYVFAGCSWHTRPIKRIDFMSGCIAIKRKGLIARDFLDQNNVTEFEAYEKFVDLADEEKSESVTE